MAKEDSTENVPVDGNDNSDGLEPVTFTLYEATRASDTPGNLAFEAGAFVGVTHIRPVDNMAFGFLSTEARYGPSSHVELIEGGENTTLYVRATNDYEADGETIGLEEGNVYIVTDGQIDPEEPWWALASVGESGTFPLSALQ